MCLFIVSLDGVLSSLKKSLKLLFTLLLSKIFLFSSVAVIRGFWKFDFCWFNERCILWIENEFCSYYSVIPAMRFMANIFKTCNGTRIQNHLVLKGTLDHLAKLVEWLSVRLRTNWFCVQLQLQSLKLQISRLLRARSSLTFRQL